MKKWQISGFLAILILGFVLISGCTSTALKNQESMAITAPTPFPTIVQAQDPIIGVWKWSESAIGDIRYRFNADHTYVHSVYNQKNLTTYVLSGTWSTQGNNSYEIFNSVTGSEIIIYSRNQNAIYSTTSPSLLLTLYQGDVMVADNAPIVAQAQDPVIGVWRLSDLTWEYDDRYKFNSDGTYIESFYNKNTKETLVYAGTWSAQGNNIYVLVSVTVKNDAFKYSKSETFIYSPNQNGIYFAESPKLLLTPYQGDVATATSAPEATSTPSSQSKVILFSEDFSSPNAAWEKEYTSSSGSKTYYKNGMLYIEDFNPQIGFMWHTLKQSFSDFRLDLDISHIDGTKNNWECVHVRGDTNMKNYYSFCISSDGYYSIVKTITNQGSSLAGPIKSTYINSGYNTKNHITIRCEGNVLAMDANGKQLATITDNSFSDGQVTLSTLAMEEKSYTLEAFDNLVIRKL